jgi:hypothetical protein
LLIHLGKFDAHADSSTNSALAYHNCLAGKNENPRRACPLSNALFVFMTESEKAFSKIYIERAGEVNKF